MFRRDSTNNFLALFLLIVEKSFWTDAQFAACRAIISGDRAYEGFPASSAAVNTLTVLPFPFLAWSALGSFECPTLLTDASLVDVADEGVDTGALAQRVIVNFMLRAHGAVARPRISVLLFLDLAFYAT